MERTEGEPALTCSLQEAAGLLGLSYEYVLGQSKIEDPENRIPGFRLGRSGYRVVVGELPGWLRRKSGLTR